ncbi:MAG TPA: hypothetical protein PKN70_11895 [Smithellaceae bacterium]|nr:hypothetical protein [Smithellaceae bacterium]
MIQKTDIQETLINLNENRKSKTSPIFPTDGKSGEILIDRIDDAISEFISMMEWQEDKTKFPTAGQKIKELQGLLSHGEAFQKLLNELSRPATLELFYSIDPSRIKEVANINNAIATALQRLNELAAPGRPPEIARDEFILTMLKIYHTATKRKPTIPNRNDDGVFQGHCFTFIKTFIAMAGGHEAHNPTFRTAYINALKFYIADNQL